ncbi:MAG: TerC/Alx family metal homeostasis membrane protein, partial [Solirubrobacterales bacterium]|nr:TerC/Alx family metal homeostasis membrane protein [Solirubrobacterales bacterium]
MILTAVLSSPAAPWVGLIAAVAVLLAIDLRVMSGRDGHMSNSFAAKASVFWILLAFGFAGLLWLSAGATEATTFVSGYLVEKSLSLDNVFVFLLLLGAFGIATDDRHRLLTYGIVGALVLRGVFIVAGAAALHAFSWINLVFAAILIWTGWRLWQHRHDHGGEEKLVAGIRERLPIGDGDHGGRLWGREESGWVLTVSGAALAGLVLVDILFAIDSVPAILAITDDAFIVFAANAFALMGLRPLFFLVADLVERLYYLKAALAVLLVVIGAKLGAAHWVGKIGPEITLPAIALVLGTG